MLRMKEGSMHTTHTSKNQSRGKSHVSHAKSERDMQCEIDELKKKSRRVWRRHSSPDSELSFEEIDDAIYRRRSRTLLSETFSGDEEYRHKRKNKSPSHKGLGNNVMNEALSQVASPSLRVCNWIVMLRVARLCLVQISIILMLANRWLVRTWLFHFQR